MKKVHLDHCVPQGLRGWLTGHSVATTHHLGWDRHENGELIRACEEAGFDVLVTADRNLRYQQNFQGRRVGIVLLPTNSWKTLRGMTGPIREAIDACHPGAYLEIG